MKIYAETARLILRELLPEDDQGMFDLDSDPEVHRFLGNNPVTDIEQVRAVIQFVRQQYIDNGIGRWAMIERETGDFIGWTGLKLVTEMRNNHINYIDVGYRLIRKFWGRGFATESTKASLVYGFHEMGLENIYATTEIGHLASRHVLEKSGLKLIEIYESEGMQYNWLQITRADFESNNK
ncbi:MAG: GNAT family N-acetyltransferase [Bacteroidota bacterium]